MHLSLATVNRMALAFIGTLVALLFTASTGNLYYRITMAVLVTMTMLVALYPFVRNEGEIWSKTVSRPIGVWALTVFIYWVYGSAATLYTDNAIYWATNRDQVVLGQLYFVLGGIALLVGYFALGKGGRQRAKDEGGYVWASWQVAIVLAGLRLGSAAFSFSLVADIKSTRIDEQVLILLESLLSATGWVAVWDSGRAKWLRAAAGGLIIEGLLRTMTAGSRYALFATLVVGVVAAVRLGRASIGKRHLLLLGGLLVGGVLITQASRDMYGYSKTWEPDTKRNEVIEKAVATLADSAFRNAGPVENLFVSVTSYRLAPVDMLAHIIDVLNRPGATFMWGESIYTGLKSVLLPYFLFPDKGSLTSSKEWFHGRVAVYLDTHTNAVQEFYTNFGLGGIIVGMLFLGYVWRILERMTLERCERSTAASAAYMVLVGSILGAEREMHTYLFSMLRTILILAVISLSLSFFRVRRKEV